MTATISMITAIAIAAAMNGTAGQPAGTEAPLAISAPDPSLSWGACPPIFPGACQIAVLHGDPSKPNADVFLRIGAGYVLPPHRHSSAERMILVEGQLQVRYDGSPARVLKAGNYAFGPAGLPHDGKCLSTTPCTLSIAFEGPVDAEPVPPARP